MGFTKEFKDFALKGNVVDLAVGVIIGAAFKTIVDSVVNDLILPVVGIFLKSDFSNLYMPLSQKGIDAKDVKPTMTLIEAKTLGPVFAWGNFVTAAFNFIILAAIIFLMVKAINKMKLKQPPPPPPPPAAPSSTDKLLMEIRDELKK